MLLLDHLERIQICAPIVGADRQSIERQVLDAVHAEVDVLELRFDCWMAKSGIIPVRYVERLLETIEWVHQLAPSLPLLGTWRTIGEGGACPLKEVQYEELLETCINQGILSAIDIELFSYRESFKPLVAAAKESSMTIIMSYHNFQETPEEEALQIYAQRMMELGADVIKFATMPQTSDDVWRMLSLTKYWQESFPHIPRITMSMGRLGQVTRTCGTVFGNCMTFGTIGEASAPGQVPVDILKALRG